MSTKRFNSNPQVQQHENLKNQKTQKGENLHTSHCPSTQKQHKYAKNKLNTKPEQRGCEDLPNSAQTEFTQSSNSNATVPTLTSDNTVEFTPASSFVPSSSAEHSINDSLNQTDDSNENINSNDEFSNLAEAPANPCDQDHFNCSPIYSQEINCNTSGGYNSTIDYEYSNGTVPCAQQQQQQQQMPQGSPYYVYQSPYSDYNQLTHINPMITNTPQQQTTVLNNSNNYYPCGYQAYVYDPNLCAYTLNTYSPMQTNQQQALPQQQPAVLSSPQHQSTMLASYQTPRQAQHQLYITPSCISPSDSNTNSSATPNSQNSASGSSDALISNCNSPQQSQQAYYPSNPYLVYPAATNPYLTPQAYQSPIATGQAQHTYMMYQPAQMPINQTPTSIQSVPIAQNNNTGYTNRYNRSNRYNNRHYKKNNQRYNNNMTSVESTPQFPVYNQPQNIYQSNSASPISCSTDSNQNQGDEACTGGVCVDQNGQNMYAPGVNPYEYCDPNQMVNLQSYYEYVNGGITTYGDDFDEDENAPDGDVDEENEQLACYTCRGRRMCFCYFLKVRYYKFPSFLDLVDHQYKKWKSNAAKAKKTA